MNAPAARRLWALDGATFTIDSSILVVGAQGEVTIPVPSYLIEHPRGLVLFDTGIAPQAAEDPHAVYGELADLINVEFTPEQRVDRQIEALGYRVEDVTHVIASHSHFDHCGGLYLFGHADMYIGEGDLSYAYWPLAAASPFFRTQDFEPTRSHRWHQVSGDLDLFGDGSVVMLAMPGHTPGNTSLLVRLPEQTLILAADTVHLRSALDGELPMPSDYSTLDAVRSVRRLRQLSSSFDAPVWIAHDPDDWVKFGHAPHSLS